MSADPNYPDFSRLAEVYDLAGKAQVSFTFNYNEGEQNFDFSVSSAAPSECWMGKDGSFDGAVDSVLHHLRSIQPYD